MHPGQGAGDLVDAPGFGGIVTRTIGGRSSGMRTRACRTIATQTSICAIVDVSHVHANQVSLIDCLGSCVLIGSISMTRGEGVTCLRQILWKSIEDPSAPAFPSLRWSPSPSCDDQDEEGRLGPDYSSPWPYARLQRASSSCKGSRRTACKLGRPASHRETRPVAAECRNLSQQWRSGLRPRPAAMRARCGNTLAPREARLRPLVRSGPRPRLHLIVLNICQGCRHLRDSWWMQWIWIADIENSTPEIFSFCALYSSRGFGQILPKLQHISNCPR